MAEHGGTGGRAYAVLTAAGPVPRRAAHDARGIRGAGDPVEACLSFDPGRGQVGALFCRRTGAGVGKVLVDRIKPGRSQLRLRTQVPNAGAQWLHAGEGFIEGRQAEPEPSGTVPEIEREWRG
ncbi:hypothetical protein [Rhodobacteraceae bacterium DSL-40]|uniref:hypothetical protein n=1 Tax=Amaricoccus sp. B4 TaxID=3368557 RepID=UPI000DAF2D2D